MSGSLSNDFNTGRDCTTVITHPLARDGVLTMPLQTDFDAKPTFHDITGNHLDGFTRTKHVPQNVTLTWNVDRSTSAVDDFIIALWKAYRLTGRIPDGVVTKYVTEIGGGISTTVYTGVSFKTDNLGSWKKDSATKQTLTGTAMDQGAV